MLFHVIFVCGVVLPILHYYSVFGKRESLHRFIVEDEAKPAIFGSYSYDPVKQAFLPPPTQDGENDWTDSPRTSPRPGGIAYPGGKPPNINCLNDSRRPEFRKHVTDQLQLSTNATVTVTETPGFPITNWWDKPTVSIPTPNVTEKVTNKV